MTRQPAPGVHENFASNRMEQDDLPPEETAIATCESCGKHVQEGEPYLAGPDTSLCGECSPIYQALLDESDGFVDNDGEPLTPEQCREWFDKHIAGGGKPTDSMATIKPELIPLAGGLTELETELLSALKLFRDTIIGEVHDKWDEGMRAGKLIVALANPTFKYRADISGIHAAIAKAEAALASPAEVVETPPPETHSIPSHVRDFLGKVQGVCMGVAMSGDDHPNPDGALMELVEEAQAILFPATEQQS